MRAGGGLRASLVGLLLIGVLMSLQFGACDWMGKLRTKTDGESPHTASVSIRSDGGSSKGHDGGSDGSTTVSVENAKLKVTAATRLTPPEVRAGENSFGVRDPWNVNFTRLKFSEDGINGETGQASIVWARIDDLRRAKTLNEYLAVRHRVHPNWEFDESVWWSPFPDEENILYAIHKPTHTIMRWNVDTETGETVVPLDPGDNPRLMGFTLDHILICNRQGEDSSQGAWEIDVKAKTRKFNPRADGPGYPVESHGHSSLSPDRKGSVTYYGGTSHKPSGEVYHQPSAESFNPPFMPTYITWKASNEWWVAKDVGDNTTAKELAGNHPWPTAPYIQTYTLAQCRFDGSCDQFYTYKAVGTWDDNGETVWNWGIQGIPTQRRDGKQIVLVHTDGKYSQEDNQRRGVQPWGNPGLFLLDIDLGDGKKPF